MSRNASFRVETWTKTNGFDGALSATVTIDRGTGLFTVRPLRRRKTFTATLAGLARDVIVASIRRENADKARLKKEKRLAKKRGLL